MGKNKIIQPATLCGIVAVTFPVDRLNVNTPIGIAPLNSKIGTIPIKIVSKYFTISGKVAINDLLIKFLYILLQKNTFDNTFF